MNSENNVHLYCYMPNTLSKVEKNRGTTPKLDLPIVVAAESKYRY